jgi:transcriptional regulator with XRE-family HTH domain
MNTNDFAKQIPDNLSRIRKEQHYTQKDLAIRAGLNPNYYAKVERGDGIPSLKTLVKIAKALDVSISEIVGY